MKDFCTRILTGSQVSEQEAVSFITEYLEMNNKKFESKHISAIMQMIQMGYFDIRHAVRMYCAKKNYQINTLSNLKDNSIIKIWINEGHTDHKG